MNSTLTKQIGVWLDHSKAHFIGYNDGSAFVIETIDAVHGHEHFSGEGSTNMRLSSNPQHASNNEHHTHNIEHKELSAYFKTLESKLAGYDEILLFGPTTAKEQLNNFLAENKSFAEKTISVQSSDKLSDNQMLAFVRDFFKI